MGVEDLRSAWEACPNECIPIALGDMNINWDPWNEWEKLIVNLLNEINLVDTSRKFAPQQGGPLSAKLFNILVGAMVQEWLHILRSEMVEEDEEELDQIMVALFAIFYVDDPYVVARDPVFLQRVFDVLVNTCTCVGLETNITKTQAMICMSGKIRIQLPEVSYGQMRTG